MPSPCHTNSTHPADCGVTGPPFDGAALAALGNTRSKTASAGPSSVKRTLGRMVPSLWPVDTGPCQPRSLRGTGQVDPRLSEPRHQIGSLLFRAAFTAVTVAHLRPPGPIPAPSGGAASGTAILVPPRAGLPA